MTLNQRRKRRRGETTWFKPRKITISRETTYTVVRTLHVETSTGRWVLDTCTCPSDRRVIGWNDNYCQACKRNFIL